MAPPSTVEPASARRERPELEPADLASFETPFMVNLVRLVRAYDTFGSRDSRSDADTVEEFIVTREQRRRMPIIADPDARTLWRVKVFHDAIAQTIEKGSGVVATPMLDISGEGFGRAVVIAGRLVALDRQLRDVHRFGFESYAKLASEGEALVAKAVEAIREHPQVAGL